MSDVVVLRTYASEFEAQLDAAILEANEIHAHVAADTAGGAYPGLSFLSPVRLLVYHEDAAVARELLESSADDAPGEVAPG